MSELDVTLRDGRTLHVYDEGDPNGEPLVVHHGTPGSGLLYGPEVADAKEKGLRLIGYDRAGYGGSSPNPGRGVADVAGDIADVLDHLEIDRFASMGGSGGGPHSLALGAFLPDRCVAVCAMASPAPWQAEGLDWLQGQGEQNRAEWAAALEGPDVLEPHLEKDAADLLAASAEEIREVLSTLLSPVDREVVTGALAEYIHASTAWALRPGVAGWRDDDLAFTKPWGFELADIRSPVLLWQGVQDLMVPPDHGRWLAERIPGVEAHISEEDGHITILERRTPEIHLWLLDRLRA
ncbi:MAG: alpha/beta hydrolase fold protein [Actinomycetia bacterium]|nr:alpha/beta hydrolase fold protein [Actinomycetes bacterium]